LGNILVVDDTPANLRLLTSLLKENGYEVRPASNGHLALRTVESTLPDLILLDIMMPDLNGYEVCQRLKASERSRDVPIIFISAINETMDKVKAFSLGGVDYITKPFEPEEVLARVKTQINIRTMQKELMERTVQLNAKVEELTKTRDELVQSEKMASLGRLVAGFAHELNTPIGVAITTASTLQENVKTIHQLFAQEEIDIDVLLAKLKNIDEGAELTLSNLERAATLVSSFKRTAVDQTSEEVRTFKVEEVMIDTISTLANQFKNTAIEIQVICPKSIKVKSIPGALEQILTNLLINSLIHGFNEGKQSGRITITVQQVENQLHIIYIDNGQGISLENQEKIFEPFFTTHRAHGGSGLGMYICYNLLVNQLKGSITCESVLHEGVKFTIIFPLEILQ
jgi:signal transduction histidine kinase